MVQHGADGGTLFQQRQILFIVARAAAQNHIRSGDKHRFARVNPRQQHLATPARRRFTQFEINGRFIVAQRFQPVADGVIDARAKAAVRRDLIRLNRGKLSADVFL